MRDLNDEMRALVDGRVMWIEDGIVLVNELPAPTPASVDAMFDEIARVTAGRQKFAMLVDLSRTERPNAEIRQKLRARIHRERDRIGHCALFTGTFVVAVAIKFIIGDISVSVSTHKHRDDALEAIRRVA